ncbi:MAG: hypothetical protein WCL44_03410 [bacterium]
MRLTTMIILLGICSCTAFAQIAKPAALTVGVRQYTDHSADTKSPFGEGDLSYLLAYEYHEGGAFWQLGLSYAPYASATSMVAVTESVTTPQLRLVFQESMLLLGVGVLKHYIMQIDGNKWSDLYWEIQAGLYASVSKSLEVRGMAYYTFSDWSEIDNFDTSQLELGVEFAYRF